MNYLPINIKLKNKTVWVFGAGEVATRKISALIKVKARIHCFAKDFNDAISTWEAAGKLSTHQMDLEDIDISNLGKKPQLMVSATGNPIVSKQAYEFAEQHNILLNTVDEPDLCNYLTPAIVDRSPLLIAISTEGSSPVLARLLKQKIEKLLPFGLQKIVKQAKSLRPLIKKKIKQSQARRAFWEQYFDHDNQLILDETQFEENSTQAVNQLIRHNQTTKGKVYLVGAGPGNPELLTIKALQVMQKADVVLHDQLIPQPIIDLIRKDAQMIDVGKSAGNHKTKQANINQLLVEWANKGLRVCRLKGGDPFVFGRGGEEIQTLNEHGIDFEIVPGITAAIGCAAYSGIPLTHRDHAQSVTFLTGHCQSSQDTIDWQFYAKDKQTLVVYMGLIKSPVLQERLITHGKNPEEPIAIIENGTAENQRVVTGQLSHLSELIQEHDVQSPALIVIGEVAQYAEQFNWYNKNEAITKLKLSA
ncbi:siroheme synthase CysG [Marinicella rhabdoformis]|uniref:siroheme synthase CysG n=1 Tax=Marinicella rhabdoformis TaxID=2580566 RepID=UPI0015D0C22D|nr:siroheme synthase CysG [Marinicella rhabdoformis]